VHWLDANARSLSPSPPPTHRSGAEGPPAAPGFPKQHILTVALEDYYQTAPFKRLVNRAHWYRFETRLEIGTLRALDLLDQFGARATFFALGWVADAAPELIRRIVERGHEIATRGYFHRSLGEFSREEFRDDLVRAREALEGAAGQRVVGFRVAEGWLTRRDLWVFEVLAELGFEYDSSIKPILREWAREPHRRFLHRQTAGDRTLWEVPFSSARLLGQDVPIAGGNYFRQWPAGLVRHGVARWDRDCRAPFVMYFHTWELDPAQPRINGTSLLSRLRQYRNLERMPGLLGHYLAAYRFTSVAERLMLQLPRTAQPTLERQTIQATTGAGREALTIVVPCYNEAGSLPYLANTLQSVRASLAGRYEVSVVLVDDASRDDTWDVMNRLFSRDPAARCYRQPKNRGAAAAILRGIRHSETPIVCSIDADCSYDPHQLIGMLPLLREGVDVVTASPYHPAGVVRNVPGWRLGLSKVASWLYRRVFRHQLYTYTSCFRVYRRSKVVEVQVRRGGFVGIAEMLGHLELAGARIVECPATLDARLIGYSKMNVLRTAVGHLVLMARLARLRFGGGRLTGMPVPREERQDEQTAA
jgi:polysaccharide deacetylase family protein (PEP-CTERM system associated)